jgi:two-component system NtrC family sensor kinase
MKIQFYYSHFSLPIAYKLLLGFTLISLIGNLFFTLVGISLMGNRILAEAQERVRTDLNSAREIYQGELKHLYDVVRLNANRLLLQEAFLKGETEFVLNELTKTKINESLDILSLTDERGKVVLRTNQPDSRGDDQSHDNLIATVLRTQRPVLSTELISAEELRKESDNLTERAYLVFIDTPMARIRTDFFETSGMLLKAAAPVFDLRGNFSGVLYGGILLNRNYDIVDKIKYTVYQGVKYKGEDIGTATIFQDDVRISTNVMTMNGKRAIGTRVAEDVYNQVIGEGEPWIGRAYVVNNWYITAYEPVKNIIGDVIGMLYVGILEQKYVDLKNQAVLAFVLISMLTFLGSIILSVLLARSISIPVNKLASASTELANGNLDVKVEKTSNDEIGKLADSFNAMAAALKDRDDRIKEFTRQKIMESERMALIGQLAANIAHELNNPLQGIVTYSHLLLEKNSCEGAAKQSVEKIVIQANRCREIIRGLLDFSRQRKPDKTLSNVNTLLKDCVYLLENQATFHNIEIIMNLDKDLSRVIIDPSQVERVFMNLIINAAEAMDGHGRLTMTTQNDPVFNEIEIFISDTGSGIKEVDLDKIFDPFFTTKETGHGVGLGLAISYGIIKEHKGSILVESQVNKGTTFTIRLPSISTVDEEYEQST